MGVSIYYTCERAQKLTSSEEQAITTIIDQYNAEFTLKDVGETFYIYDFDETEPTVIFSGSTKLPFLMTLKIHWTHYCIGSPA